MHRLQPNCCIKCEEPAHKGENILFVPSTVGEKVNQFGILDEKGTCQHAYFKLHSEPTKCHQNFQI